MKITIEEPQVGSEEEIIVRCHSISPELMSVINTLKTADTMLIASLGNDIYRINPTDVYYIETVDKRNSMKIIKKLCS